MKISLKDVDWLRTSLVLILLLDLGLGWFAYQTSEENAQDSFGEAAAPGIQIGETADAGIVDLPAPPEEEVATRVAEAQVLLANWDPFKDPTALLAQMAAPAEGEAGAKPVIDVSQFTIRALLTFGRDRYVLLETKGKTGLRSFTVGARLPDDSTVLIREITRDGVLFTAPDRESTWLRIPRSREGRGSGWFGRDIAGETRGIRVEITER